LTSPVQAQYSVRAVARALDILFCFTRLSRRLSNAEISNHVSLNPSTVHRLLACLQDAGLVSQSIEDRRYQLGPAVAELYQAWDQQFDLRALARPAMRRLWQETAETVGLSVLDGRARVYVDQIESPQVIRSSFPLGVPQPLHAGAPGRVVLAFGDEALRERVLAGPLEALGPRTLTDPDRVRIELETTRQRGYAISVEEWAAGGAGIAGPILDGQSQLLAVLSVSLPAQRLTPERQQHLVNALLAATAEINRLVRGRATGAAEVVVALGAVARRSRRRRPARKRVEPTARAEPARMD
jgi:DNA-binding IclR family transcriptional regulator